MKFLLAAVLCVFTVKSHALSQGLSLGGGAFQHNMFSLTKDKTGKAETWGDTYLPLGFQYSFAATEGWHFVPSLYFSHLTTMVDAKETPEKGAKKNILFLNLPFVANATSWLDVKWGLGVFRYEIKGKGGTVTLNNGNGTATFYRPSDTRVSYNTYVLLGASFPFTDWYLDFDLMISGAASSVRRSYSSYLYITVPYSN